MDALSQPESAIPFAVGDIVDVKGHGRASVIEPMSSCSPDSPNHGRVHVRYHEDGTTYWCRPKLLRRMYPTAKRLLVARSTSAYRDAIVHNVDRPDVCLEIGCHEGLTSNMISNRASFVTGVDTAPEVVAIAQRRHPHLAFHQLDGLDVEATRALSPTGTFTRICIDISGKAPLELICHMIVAQRKAFPGAALIVKNEELFDALTAREQRRLPPPVRVAARGGGVDGHAPAGRDEASPAAPPPTQATQPEPIVPPENHDGPPAGPRHAPLQSLPLTRDETLMAMRRAAAAAATRQLATQPAAAAAAGAPVASACRADGGDGGSDGNGGSGASHLGDVSSSYSTITAGSGSAETAASVPAGYIPVDSRAAPGAAALLTPPPSATPSASAPAPVSSKPTAPAPADPAVAAGVAVAAISAVATAEAGPMVDPLEAVQLQLEALLGEALLADSEVFRHQSQLPRTRPRRGHGKAAADPPPAASRGGEAPRAADPAPKPSSATQPVP